MKMVLMAVVVAGTIMMPVASAAEGPYTKEEAKRILDVPIVRSAKGCVAFLGQNKRGLVIVSYPKNSKGKPVCQRDLAYEPGQIGGR